MHFSTRYQICHRLTGTRCDFYRIGFQHNHVLLHSICAFFHSCNHMRRHLSRADGQGEGRRRCLQKLLRRALSVFDQTVYDGCDGGQLLTVQVLQLCSQLI